MATTETRFAHLTSEATEIELASGTYIIRRYGILSTPFVQYEAWELHCGHSTAMHSDEHGRIGKLATRALPIEFDNLTLYPYGSNRRLIALHDRRMKIQAEAHAAILAAYPDALAREGAHVDGADIRTAENC